MTADMMLSIFAMLFVVCWNIFCLLRIKVILNDDKKDKINVYTLACSMSIVTGCVFALVVGT